MLQVIKVEIVYKKWKRHEKCKLHILKTLLTLLKG